MIDYVSMKMAKIPLQMDPSKITQGTTLWGQKWVNKKITIPQSIAVHSDVKIASTTEKMAYFVDVLLILSTISFKLLSVGRQNRPILPNFTTQIP